MPRVTHVQAARKDQGKCEKCGTPLLAGQPYLHWKFRYGGTHKRCPQCPPKAGDLTQSEFLAQLYDLQDRVAGVENEDDRDNLADDIDQLGQDQQEKLDNMPEGLQEGDTGQRIQARVEGCEDWAERLRNHDYPTDEDDLEEGQTLEDAVQEWLDNVHDEQYDGEM